MATDALTVREAGYVTDLTFAAVNRMIDSRRVPRSAMVRRKRERMLTLPGVVYVAIEKAAEGAFTTVLRRKLRARLRREIDGLEPSGAKRRKQVSVELGGVRGVVELNAVWRRIAGRLRRIRRMHDLIVEQDDVQAGAATFAGTRILVRPILDALKDGDAPDALRKAYPRLTREMLDVAKLYGETTPRRGRPKAKTTGLTPSSVRRVAAPR